ncbi:hypothetical protein HPB49_005815 [Dermacentor silvarum]|uniref:Uncharacterized protein n=1 Tax=Dermacentor silvarum TaxID=543639 RepID=A0ACB8DV87_DERSI|nr:hypothetical protein HPB49_005815 [Dermacentor silvarum]
MNVLRDKRCSPFRPYVVRDYFKRVEFQQRGSAHVHVILWLEDAPEDEELSGAEGAMPKTLDCRLLPFFGPLRPQPSLTLPGSSSRTASTSCHKDFKLAKVFTAQFSCYRQRQSSTPLSPGHKEQSAREQPRIYKYRPRRMPVWGTSPQGTRSRKCPFSCRMDSYGFPG